MPQMTKAKRFGDHGDPRCVYMYIYTIYLSSWKNFSIFSGATIYIYILPVIYIYIYMIIYTYIYISVKSEGSKLAEVG